MKLYFTRHGKTEWNQEMRFQGMHGDSPLLPASHEEIKKLGQHLKDVPFAKVYCSTSQRARTTAQGIVAELAQPVEIVYTEDLRELGLGELEGRTIAGRRKHYGDILDSMRYRLDRYDPTPFKGEMIQHAIGRIRNVVTEAVAENTGAAPLLFVGHGASLTASVQYLAGKKMANLRDQGGMLNNSLSILDTNGNEEPPYEMLLWNDVSFLKG